MRIELERRIIGRLLADGIFPTYTRKNNNQKRLLSASDQDTDGLGVTLLEGSYCLVKRHPPSPKDPQGAVTRVQLKDGVATNEELGEGQARYGS